jgi:hypothetical protein
MGGSMTRRGVLAGAAALAGLTSLPGILNASGIGHVVVDERLAHSVAFAGGFDGSRIHRVSAMDDLCNRWYTRMRREVLADGTAIAGLTTWMDYVVMRGCAAEIGYRRSRYAEHRAASGHVHAVTWMFSPRSV